MRLIEALILTVTFLSLILSLVLPADRRRWLTWLVLGDLLLVVLHLLQEGYRWQMLPVYLLVVLLLLLLAWSRSYPPRKRTGWTIFLTLAGLLFFVVAVALTVIFPVPRLAEPGGSYPVGTTTVHLVDASRPEIYTEEPDDVREIMVQFWYPAAAAEGERAPYIDNLDVAGPAVASRLNLPSFLLNHVNLVETHSFQEAPVADSGPFPLLIFSHGLRGLRSQNTVLLEQLASHGYVVASIDHTYGNVLTVFPGERVVFYNEQMVFPEGLSTVEAGARLVDVWAADVVFVFEQLADWQTESAYPFAQQTDVEQIGTLGHSTGGGTALEACAGIAACNAVVGLDAWIEPVAESIVEGYPRPLLLLSAPDWLGPDNTEQGRRLYTARGNTGILLTIAGTEHFDFTDLPLLSPLSPLLGLSGSIESERALEIISSYTLAFFDEQLKGKSSELLDEPSAAFEEVGFE